MAERHVLVTVKIAEAGRRCADWVSDVEACPYLRSGWSRCSLFHVELEREEREPDASDFLRAPACLALDEVAHG